MACTEQRQEELIAELAAATGTMHLATARVVELLATTFDEGAWACSGIKSREHFVMWQLGVSRRRAEGLVALAMRRSELPATTARFDAGELSEDHAASIAQRCPVSHEARTVERAPMLTHPQLTRALRLLPPLPEPPVDPDEPERSPRLPRRELRFGYDDSGSFSGRFGLPGDEGALLEAALRRHRQELFDEGGNDESHITWADALVRLATAGLTADSDGTERDRYIVNIHVDADTDNAPTAIHLGPLLDTTTRRLHTCDATIRAFLREHGRVVAKGRRRRVVEATLRALIEARDGGCVHPFCTRTRWVDVHHLVHWEDGGPTDPDNLTSH